MKNKQYKIDIKFDKAFFKLRKLLYLYFMRDYSKDDIEVAFQYACDYFYKILEELHKE